MPYFKRSLVRRMPPRRRGMMGMGDYSDATQCSEIPSGDPYRKPGNYCATPDGGTTTFNADGTTYRAPGYAVDPDPAHPAGSSASSSGGFLDTLLKTFSIGTMSPTAPVAAAGPGGLSTTTLLLLAAGGVAVALLMSRR